MRQTLTKFKSQVLTLVLTIAALAVGQSAWAASTFTIDASYNSNTHKTTFTITRTGNTALAETIDWRVVSLSAIAGQHFTVDDQSGYAGTATFSVGISTASVTISENTPGTDAYKYQTGTERTYRFEVLDRDGYILASKDRSMTTGTSVPSSGLFNEKEITIFTTGTQFTDAGYNQSNNPHYIESSAYYNLTGIAPKAYYTLIGAQLRSTLSLEAREENNGYQYVQILINNISTCDNRSDCSNGDPGNINLSRYMAGFDHEPSKANTNYATYTFPVTSQPNNCSEVSNAWSNGVTNKLYTQKFNTNCRATDGRLILPLDFEKFVVRFNASGGGSDRDEWLAKNVKAHIQACDPTAPTVLNNYKVSGGRHQKGNTIYVSVAFGEIVTITGSTKKLITSWGDLAYEEGSGTNVLTFKGEIGSSASGTLKITGMSGTINDLAGNSFSNPWSSNNKDLGTVLDADYAWTTSDFNQLETNTYEIYTTLDMRHLALMVNSGNNNCSGLTFRQTHDITYTHKTEWDDATSTENNYIAIGIYNYTFKGTFDGQNHTISGIRLYKGGNTNADKWQGLFGQISKGTVKGVNLSDTRITGDDEVGGIAGDIFETTIKDCTVAATVCIHAVQSNSNHHGGIVGINQGTVQRCLSRARLTVTDASDCENYGAIVGKNLDGEIKDCIVIGATVPNVNKCGAIIGYHYYLNSGNYIQRNYYRGCTVAGVENATGVGVGYEDSSTSPHDVTANQGAQALYAVTLPTPVSLVRTASATLPGTGNKTYTTGADIEGTPYAFNWAQLSLSYDATAIPDGYDVLLSVTNTVGGYAVTFTDHGNHTYTISLMPAADITVSVTQIPVISYIDADGNPQSHACIPIVSDTHSYKTPGRTEGWYVVNNDVTDDYGWSSKFEDNAVHIILCDGKTFSRRTSANGHDAIEVKNGSLSIYGQSLGTGRLIATSDAYGISVMYDINFNGGIVSSTANNTNSVYSSKGNITIRRGNITAQATTYGIKSRSGTIILGCSSTADHITANGYYAEKGVKVADGQTLTDGISSHTFTGTLSSDQKAAIAGKTLMKSLGNVAYLDGNGQAQTCSDYTILWDSTIPVDGSDEGSIGTADQDSWYVASTDYTFGKKLNALGHVHLILLDGATFTVNGTETGLNSKDLSIYGQSLGTGTLTASATDKAMFVDGNLVINGGITHATGGNYGIYVDGGYLAINGGTINATGAIKDIYVNSGTMELVNDNGTWTASFSDSSTETVNIPTNITVDNVSLNRTFTANKAATLMLPFDIDVANTSGAAFYTYTGVTFDTETNKWKATMTQVESGTIAANTPYVVMPTDAAITFTGSVTLNTTTNSQQTTNGDWTFKGTYEKKTWTAADCGNDYGFAATSGTATDGVTAVQAGDFVKLAEGAWIRPMRAYLTYTGTGNPWAAPKHRAGTELPQSISVILVNANGEVTEVNGVIEVNDNSWYTLDGRKLDKQPTTKGLYINNGKKTVIK